jgi:flagellum-specific ATP synthase
MSISRLAQLGATAREIFAPGALLNIAGHVVSIDGSSIKVSGLSSFVKINDYVRIGREDPRQLGEVLAMDLSLTSIRALDQNAQVAIGTRVSYEGPLLLHPSNNWKGRVISSLAEPMDSMGPLDRGSNSVPLIQSPPDSMRRAMVRERVITGVKAVDIFSPLCFGQRIGIFAGSGVGKSTLMSMIANAEGFDTVVVALVGERGREVTEFVHGVLGNALQKAVVVVATGDESASRRKLAPLVATAIAEHFRDQGGRVLLIMDSVTRFAHALRETALASGEPPVARGYPPSVFGNLPQLLERAGPAADGGGSITGIYAVLVDGDNHNEPVSDVIRGTLDGHIVLARQIAAAGRYPAIDLLGSLSRLADKALTSEEAVLARRFRRLISRYEDTKDLRLLGGYQPGSDAELDTAVAFVPQFYEFLNQGPGDGHVAHAFDLASSTLMQCAAAVQQRRNTA